MTGEETQRQIILADLNGFSKLSDQDQFRTISSITQAITAECQEGGWVQPHATTSQKWIDHFICTGDGFYVLLNPSIERKSIHGLAIAIAIRSEVLKNRTLPSIKIAVHWGTTIEFEDITGNINFVGTGMNYCARLLGLGDHLAGIRQEEFPEVFDARNFIAISEDLATHQDWRALETFPAFKMAGPFDFRVKTQRVRCYAVQADALEVKRVRSYDPDGEH